ncbi:hypothetical protein IAT40_003120 [Kwoniella sp. CBS 6097]
MTTPSKRITRSVNDHISSNKNDKNRHATRTLSPVTGDLGAEDEEGEEEIDHLDDRSSPPAPAEASTIEEGGGAIAGPGPNTLKRRREAKSEVAGGTRKQPRRSTSTRNRPATSETPDAGSAADSRVAGTDDDESDDKEKEQAEPGAGGIGQVDWLKIGEVFPWDRIVFYFDTSVDDDMMAHLTKRIKKVKGKSTSTITEADIILINPHPSRLSSGRLNLLSSLDQVQSNDCLILAYHWLSRCYFSRKVEAWISDVPVFVEPKGDLVGQGMKIAVGRLGEELKADKLRRQIMEDLEKNGALIVPNEEASTCILAPGHPMLIDKPQVGPWSKCTLHPPGWVQERITEAKETQKRAIKPSVVLEMSKIKVTSAGINGKKAPTSLSSSKRLQMKTKPPRSAHRHEFIAHDREMLARWLAYKRPEKTGRTTRSIYEELGAYSNKHPNYSWASRHTPSAWHEHFKRNRNKVGNDGKILEDEVERYVSKGVDQSLKTIQERSKGTAATHTTASTYTTSKGRVSDGGTNRRGSAAMRGNTRKSSSKEQEKKGDRSGGRLSFSKDASDDEGGSLETSKHLASGDGDGDGGDRPDASEDESVNNNKDNGESVGGSSGETMADSEEVDGSV